MRGGYALPHDGRVKRTPSHFLLPFPRHLALVVGAKNTLSIIGMFSELIFDYRTKIKVKIENRPTRNPKNRKKLAIIGEAQVVFRHRCHGEGSYAKILKTLTFFHFKRLIGFVNNFK